jgi:hypothetical protein
MSQKEKMNSPYLNSILFFGSTFFSYSNENSFIEIENYKNIFNNNIFNEMKHKIIGI